MGPNGLSFDLPADVSPFDYFARSAAAAGPAALPEPTYVTQDLPPEPAPIEADAHVMPDPLASDHLRLALIVQEMAAFDRSGAEGRRLRQQVNDIGRFDFVA